MQKDNFTYEVKCRTCRRPFKVQLFESHEKNLFLVAKKDWYCEDCKQDYFNAQTKELTKAQETQGFRELTGTAKMVSWAVQIRKDMLKKVEYLKNSLKFVDEDQKAKSEAAFRRFLEQWQEETDAKWWIDHRQMNVRDISKKIEEIMGNGL